MCLKNRAAILVVLMDLVQGMKITPFVSPWSTMTKIESKLEESRRSVNRLQEICWNRQEAKDKMGQSPRTVG